MADPNDIVNKMKSLSSGRWLFTVDITKLKVMYKFCIRHYTLSASGWNPKQARVCSFRQSLKGRLLRKLHFRKDGEVREEVRWIPGEAHARQGKETCKGPEAWMGQHFRAIGRCQWGGNKGNQQQMLTAYGADSSSVFKKFLSWHLLKVYNVSDFV